MSALRRIRKDVLSLSQAEIAALVGVSQGTVSKWENGELAPSLSEMAIIRSEARSRGLEWDDRWFFDPSPQPTPNHSHDDQHDHRDDGAASDSVHPKSPEVSEA